MPACPKPTPRRIEKARDARAHQKVVKDVRAQCMERAEGCCERCGLPCRRTGQGHHRIPRSRGGLWTIENIEILCWRCHRLAHAENDL